MTKLTAEAVVDDYNDQVVVLINDVGVLAVPLVHAGTEEIEEEVVIASLTAFADVLEDLVRKEQS